MLKKKLILVIQVNRDLQIEDCSINFRLVWIKFQQRLFFLWNINNGVQKGRNMKIIKSKLMDWSMMKTFYKR